METLNELIEKTEGLTFGAALQLLKAGRMVQRKGWNGKGMFLFIHPEFSCSLEAFLKIVSVPESVKSKIVDVLETENLNPTYKFTAYVSMFAADRTIVNGWVPSQPDVLATDWQIV